MRQDNTIYKSSIKLSFSSIGQDKSKVQKEISEPTYLNFNGSWIEMTG